jgi:hypothetical protein
MIAMEAAVDPAIARVLEQLCEHFDDELERQQNVLVVCRALGQGARAHDHEYLEAKTAALHVLLRQAVAAEQVRLALVRRVVDHFELSESQQTLSGLIAAVPEPWCQRMQEFQVLMRATLESTRRLVRENNRVMRRALTVLNETMNALALCEPEHPGSYDGQGEGRGRTRTAPALIDHRG